VLASSHAACPIRQRPLPRLKTIAPSSLTFAPSLPSLLHSMHVSFVHFVNSVLEVQ
jgi:hypothetical protein